VPTPETTEASSTQPLQAHYLEPRPDAEPLILPATLEEAHERLREFEAQSQKLTRELHSAREDLIQSLVALGDAQSAVAALREEVAERTQEGNDWRAYLEAVQNDLEQANALATDFRAQFSEKSNEMAELRRAHEQALKTAAPVVVHAVPEGELVAARAEAARLQKALEHAMELVREGAVGQVTERRQWELNLGRVRDELAAAQAENEQLRKQKAPGGSAPNERKASTPAEERDLNEALLEVELKIGKIRGQFASGRSRQTQMKLEDEDFDVAFEP
jgi:uncharacterized protein YdbL (DUF1318 family)